MLSREFVKELKERLGKSYAVNEETGCWIWTQLRGGRYGIVYMPSLKNSLYAHRAAFMLKTGEEVPDKFLVCHKCDTPACINPDHLFAGTSSDNQQDMKQKGRSLAGSKNGHSILSEADVLEIYKRVDSGCSYKSLGIEYKVSATNIRRIALGINWNHLYKSRRASNECA